ncbi:MAG TPA: thymidine phosphorylase [Candidatus Woesearchaeota archaeon]|nr:thymidine phosphorylase [Candidatus Woesearchaeota archaeon]
MRFRLKRIQISSGGPMIAVMNISDAAENNLHRGDRIELIKGAKKAIAIVDTTKDALLVPEGWLGLNHELSSKLGQSGTADAGLIDKSHSLAYIKKKLDGKELSEKEFLSIISDIARNALSEIEITYFVSACYTHGLSNEETAFLTKAMINTGDLLKISKKFVLDKHCIGGVAGNRTTMLAVPIVAAAGYTVPKTSSRSITSPAGTADTMEVLCKVDLPLGKVKKVIAKTGACIVWGGALSLAPADDIIIRVEHPLGIDAYGQLVASVLGKKKSVSSTHVLIDIPYGQGAKVKTKARAEKLGSIFRYVGEKIGLKIFLMYSKGSKPVGKGIGPALEARDVLYVLRNDPRQPLDLRKKSLEMAGKMIEMTGKKNGFAIARKILDSGLAYEKMVEIINAQGKRHIEPGTIPLGRLSYEVKAHRSGAIQAIRNDIAVSIARAAGAPKDAEAGIYLKRLEGERILKGQALFTVYSNSEARLAHAKSICKKLSKEFYIIK